MEQHGLAPETRMALQIQLDRVHETSRRCREGLNLLGEGRISERDYMDLLTNQRRAQASWLRRHRDLFRAGHGSSVADRPESR